MNHSTVKDVWVRDGNKGVEHAARVVEVVDECNAAAHDMIAIRWNSTGEKQLVPVGAIRPMYDADNTVTATSSSAATNNSSIKGSANNAAGGVPRRKSRRVSNKPDRFDGAFEQQIYKKMTVDELKDICTEMNLPKQGTKGELILRIVRNEEDKELRSKMVKSKGQTNSKGLQNRSNSSDNIPKTTKAHGKKKSRAAVKYKKSTHHVKEKKESVEQNPTSSSMKPRRRLSEMRRRRNAMENLVRTQLETARKIPRQQCDTEESAKESNTTSSNARSQEKSGNGRRLFHSPPKDIEKSPTPMDSSVNETINFEEEEDITVCYPDPFQSYSEKDSENVDGINGVVMQNDYAQVLYARLAEARADYFDNIKMIKEMKEGAVSSEEDIVVVETWKLDAKENIDMLRSALNSALTNDNKGRKDLH